MRAYLTSNILDDCAGIKHGFGKRDAPPNGGGFLFLGGPVHAVKQVHGAKVLVIDGAERGSESPLWVGEADALLTARPGVPIGIRTADCAPILVWDPVSRVAAAIHAGWRGAAAEIVQNTLLRMVENWGCRPGDLRVAIGPCISPARYEVGAEVAEAFSRHPARLTPSLAREGHPKWLLDLPGVLLDQFTSLGVPREQMEWVGVCTLGNGDTFSSFRREGAASTRQWSIIQIDSVSV
jgi:hypothetical protein